MYGVPSMNARNVSKAKPPARCELDDKTEKDRRLSVLMKLYEVNYDYQNQKEQRLSLIFQIYITILIAAIGWAISTNQIAQTKYGIVVFGSSLLVFTLFTIIYIAYQNWLKAWSVAREYRMLEVIKRFGKEPMPGYHRIVAAAYPPKGDPIQKQKCCIFFRDGRSGVIVISILILIAMANSILLVLYLQRNPIIWIPRLFYR